MLVRRRRPTAVLRTRRAAGVTLAFLIASLLAVPGTAGAKESPLEVAFASVDASDALDALAKALAKKDESVAPALFRVALAARYSHVAVATGDALRALGGSWLGTQEFEEELSRALEDRDEGRRRNLARVLGAWADPVLDGPLAALAAAKRKPETQEEALFMAGALPSTQAEAYPKTAAAIVAALESRSPSVLVAACAAAGRRQLSEAAPRLEELALTSRARWVGVYAVRALERIGDPIPLQAFAKALRRKLKPEQRLGVLKAVGTLAGRGDLPVLVELLRNRADDVRDAALAGVHRVVAPTLFGRVEPDGGPLAGVAAGVVDALASALVELAFEDDAHDRRWDAAHALRRMGTAVPEGVSQKVEKRLASRKEDVRETALLISPALGLESAYPVALSVALEGDTPLVRARAARVLCALAPERACRDLLDSLVGKRKSVERRVRAADALGRIRHPDALDGLIAIVAEPPRKPAVRDAIEKALERLTGHRFGFDHAAWKAWAAKDPTPFAVVTSVRGVGERRRRALEEGLQGYQPLLDHSMERGLVWLVGRQHTAGYWAGEEDGLGDLREQQPTYTALALGAFTGAGYRGKVGRYRESVWRAAEFLAATQAPGGRPGGPQRWRATRGMASVTLELSITYIVPFGALALVEIWGSTGDAARRGAAQRALDHLMRARAPEGAWWWMPTREPRTGPTTLSQIVLAIGQGLGLDVDVEARDDTDLWLRACSTDWRGLVEDPADCSPDFAHTVGAKQTARVFLDTRRMSSSEREEREDLKKVSLGELGMLTWLLMGWERSHPYLVGSALHLLDAMPRGLDPPPGPLIAWVRTYWCFGSWAMYQMGGRFWRTWSERLARTIPDAQCRSGDGTYGSWEPDAARMATGRIWSTAMSIFALQSWYRFPALLAR